jgi:hypothetical protein
MTAGYTLRGVARWWRKNSEKRGEFPKIAAGA